MLKSYLTVASHGYSSNREESKGYVGSLLQVISEHGTWKTSAPGPLQAEYFHSQSSVASKLSRIKVYHTQAAMQQGIQNMTTGKRHSGAASRTLNCEGKFWGLSHFHRVAQLTEIPIYYRKKARGNGPQSRHWNKDFPLQADEFSNIHSLG